MHPVFEVQEILCLIFKCDLGEADLFRCSLVCRLWATWASDVLWSTTPIPLSRILDATGSARKEIFIMLGEQPLFAIDVGEIKEVDWRKFSALSNKISRILLESHLEEPSMQSINVAKETFGGEIFSRLRTVKTQTIDHQQKAISLLAVPSLLQVSLYCNSISDETVDWMAGTFPVLAPNVSHLGLKLGKETIFDMNQYSALTCLELFCFRIKSSFWGSLIHCPLLAKIRLDCTRRVVEQGEPGPAEYIEFPSLITFQITQGNFNVVLNLIRRSRMPMLERLQYDALGAPVNGGFYGPDIHRAVEALRVHLKSFSPKVDTSLLDPFGCNIDPKDGDDSLLTL